MYRYFKRQNDEISHEKDMATEKETESLLIAAQNNAIRINNIKAKIYNTQQYDYCKLTGDKNETINHMISECSKLVLKEYKTRCGWVGNVIHWELCKRLKFDSTLKWYMDKPESFLENKTHKIH